jgi:hypothetical protein
MPNLDVFIGEADSWDVTSTLIYGKTSTRKQLRSLCCLDAPLWNEQLLIRAMPTIGQRDRRSN